ncbi:arginyltransferase [Parvularcula marina]|uniref:Aspartate/glutamate leucyltransferase n=1 Tax=Parvularcula marina TaxID=2292771 RepID=A0A371RGW3_9PROT|nr:arginyltransferase [Parvularcula marina]RFB04697.1 arginyltransferase [Parvularcula marina]
MTTPFQSTTNEFFLTSPSPCPYLPGRRERKIFTFLGGQSAAELNAGLSERGFRRSQNIAYLPACERCQACKPVRVVAGEFKASRWKRLLRRNRDVTRHALPPRTTSEQFSVLRGYLDTRHAEGGMADMTVLDYQSMVEQTPVDTLLIEYRDGDGKLLACALTDRVKDGLSMVYSFFDPDAEKRSLGTYMILDHIEYARELCLSHVYLGYWVKGSPKMDYKRRFRPLELLEPGGWRRLED